MSCPRCFGSGRAPNTAARPWIAPVCGLCKGRGLVPPSLAESYAISEAGIDTFLATVDDPGQPWSPKHLPTARIPPAKPRTAVTVQVAGVQAPSWWRRLWTRLTGRK